jgi:uncharacterized membrane protein YqjE
MNTGPFALLASMMHTRLELAALDLETHLADTAAAMATGFAALVAALTAFAFVGITVIAIFWDTHRLLVTALTTAAYILLALLLLARARARWKSRRPAFAAVLRELERDRDALRGRL